MASRFYLARIGNRGSYFLLDGTRIIWTAWESIHLGNAGYSRYQKSGEELTDYTKGMALAYAKLVSGKEGYTAK